MNMRATTLRICSLMMVFAFGIVLAIPSRAKAEGSDVNFKTYDGVIISGKYFQSMKPKESATIILLHNFTYRKGRDDQGEQWEKFATDLQAAGHSVLMFDFRGHGKSVNVDQKFWDHPINKTLPGANKKLSKIGYTEFPASYYPNLVNDIAAAKSFLDVRNDDGEANTRNLVVIGAGEGATLGALWMASEWRRVPSEVIKLASPVGIINTRPMQEKMLLKATPATDPEGASQLAAIWMSISPTVAGKSMSQLPSWIKDITMARTRRVQMVFVTNKEDKTSDDFSLKLLKVALPTFSREKKDDGKTKTTRKDDQKLTGEFSYLTQKLTGSQLIERSKEDIIKNYLSLVTKKGDSNMRTHSKTAFDESVSQWFFGPLDKLGNPPVPPTGIGLPAKLPNDKTNVQILPTGKMGVN